MDFGLFDFLNLVGALALFIFGMKMMSDAIQKAAGGRMRLFLNAVTSNRFVGIATGLAITAAVQSSSVVTVVTVSLVNAGLLSLMQSVGVIMGANIGTTVTGWLIAELGLGPLSITRLCLPLVGIGFALTFTKQEALRHAGRILLGFALLFLGLGFMKEALAAFQDASWLGFVRDIDLQGQSYFSQLGTSFIFILIGIILTVAVQSSSAAMALTLVMTSAGWISFPVAAAIILGENIGTTVTANLAALVGNAWAKRTARVHFIINVLGVFWMIFLLPFFLEGVAEFNQNILGGGDPFADSESIPRALALFHTAFNIVNVAVLFAFAGIIVKIAKWMVPARHQKDENTGLGYIAGGIADSPELSLAEARKELIRFAELVRRTFRYVPLLITEMEEQKLKIYTAKLEDHEGVGDRLEKEIQNYLDQATRGEMSAETVAGVRSAISIASHLESIGDIYLNISRSLLARKMQKAYFTQSMRNRITKMNETVKQAMDLMVENLKDSTKLNSLEKVLELENQINRMHEDFFQEYLEKSEKGKIPFRSGLFYNQLIDEMERLGNHLKNISLAQAGVQIKARE